MEQLLYLPYMQCSKSKGEAIAVPGIAPIAGWECCRGGSAVAGSGRIATRTFLVLFGMVDPIGFEPTTSSMPLRRSSS